MFLSISLSFLVGHGNTLILFSMIRMLVFINSNKVLGTIELSEEKFVLLLEIFVE